MPMLLKRRVPRIDSRPTDPTKGFEHLDHHAIAMVRWLNANRIDYVLVGPVAEAVRGGMHAHGPVAVVLAPYSRNFERLERALWAAHARIRVDGAGEDETDTVPAKLTAEKLGRGQRWTLRCGTHDLDVEGRPAGAPDYQELLYEAARYEMAAGVTVEVAGPEDIERYRYIGRTGTAPEIRISRHAPVEQHS
jgi:hypothetical protein